MNKKVYGLIGIAALAAVGGTFAYYNASQTFNNPFDTTNFGTSTTERFNPEEGKKWKPGVEVDKKVTATNTGDGLVWVRVRFDEEWAKTASPNTKFGQWDSRNLAFFPATSSDAARYDGYQPGGDYTGQPLDIIHQPGTAEDSKAGETDGSTEDSGSVVYKNLSNVVYQDTASGEKWYYNAEDGYFYYAKALEKNESTVSLLNSVTLCGNTDMGKFNLEENWLAFVVPEGKKLDETGDPYYNSETGKWIVKYQDGNTEEKDPTAIYNPGTGKWTVDGKEEDSYTPPKDTYAYHYKANELDDILQGYAKAGYNLNITVEFVQADEEAAQAFASKWTNSAGEEIDVKWNWHPAEVAASGSNTEEGNGNGADGQEENPGQV